MPDPIVYNGLLNGAVAPAGTNPVDLEDETAGPLMKAWLLIVTNPALWVYTPGVGGPPSDAELDQYAAAIGVDRSVVDFVLAVAADPAATGTIQAVNQLWLNLTNDSGYPGQACLSTVDRLVQALNQ